MYYYITNLIYSYFFQQCSIKKFIEFIIRKKILFFFKNISETEKVVQNTSFIIQLLTCVKTAMVLSVLMIEKIHITFFKMPTYNGAPIIRTSNNWTSNYPNLYQYVFLNFILIYQFQHRFFFNLLNKQIGK